VRSSDFQKLLWLVSRFKEHVPLAEGYDLVFRAVDDENRAVYLPDIIESVVVKAG